MKQNGSGEKRPDLKGLTDGTASAASPANVGKPAPSSRLEPRVPPSAPRPAAAGPVPDPPEPSAPASGSRLITVVLCVLAVAELAAALYFYSRFYSQSLLSSSLQKQIEEAAVAAPPPTADISRHAHILAALKSEFLKVDGERRVLRTRIEERQKILAEFQSRLKLASEKAAATAAGLARQEQIASYLRTRLKESKSTELQLIERLEAAAREKADLVAKLARARDGEPDPGAAGEISLKETVVTDSAGGPREIAGQVLVSHEKYNFVIVNLGSEDGIALGDTGVIEAQGVRVGTAKVKKLYPRMCLADVAVSSPDQKIEKNAVIKFSRLPQDGGA